MSDPRRSLARAPDSTGQGLVVVVDDEPLLRAEITSILQQAGFRAESYASAEALMAIDWVERTDCLLLDAGLPGIGGVELLKRMASSVDRVPVVMISGTSDVRKAVQAMRAGACDFIEKPADEREIVAAIERAIGRKRGDAALETLQRDGARFMAQLTPRQRQILPLILDGQLSKNIAADLAISQRTVETHRAAILQKSGTKSLPALARMVFAATLAPGPTENAPIRRAATARSLRAVTSRAKANTRFERYFDQIPLAVVVSAIGVPERIIYANPAFEALSGQNRGEVEGQSWSRLRGVSVGDRPAKALGDAVLTASDLVGTFLIERPDGSATAADVFSNVIVDDDDGPTFRLAALVDVGARDAEKLQEFELLIREKDTKLLEMQHRVKNNLQMITALVRIEARKTQGQMATGPFDRLAGRINSIQLVYKLLSETDDRDQIDLGVYLSEIASSIMHAFAVEGIRLDLKVDSYPVSINVALPTGMVVNELLTNALKHAFVGRESGTITLQSLADAHGCRIVVADNGVGLPPDVSWPRHGKLGALILESLRQNAKADVAVDSKPGEGVRVTIKFSRKAAAATASRGAIGLVAKRRSQKARQ